MPIRNPSGNVSKVVSWLCDCGIQGRYWDWRQNLGVIDGQLI